MKKLEELDLPGAIKDMTDEELELLAVEIREFLVDKVSKTGGHLASNLGVVELTIALHRVFDSPKDRFIWDVGHQAYVHKILTGRAKEFDSLRKLDSMSGFPKKGESEHDVFDTGHASSSISVAEGIAEARDIKGESYDVISITGDGSLTGGLSYEALNNIGSRHTKVIVILNDNGMSISKNVGGMSEHLTNLRTSSKYYKAKKDVKTILSRIPKVGTGVARGISEIKEAIKYAILSGGVFFEQMGFTYIGPVDGHDIEKLTEALNNTRNASGPVLLHVITKKGKGYHNAEKDPNKFHGIGAFDKETGELVSKAGKSFSKVMGEEILSLAEKDDRICAITAAMGTATGLEGFSEAYPERFFDVGIAEEHAVTFAGGLATNGLKPLVAIYSSFLQRAYDEIIEDVALQKVPVVFAIDRAGTVGADGETHQGLFDISYLSTVPGMEILAPCNGTELRGALRYAFSLDTPCAIRYPRGACGEDDVNATEGTANKRLFTGKDADIFAVGPMVDAALDARAKLEKKGIKVGVVKVIKAHPVDTDEVRKRRPIFTIEDGNTTGGYGEQLRSKISNEVIISAYPDTFVEHGDVKSLYKRYGLDGAGLAKTIRRYFERKD